MASQTLYRISAVSSPGPVARIRLQTAVSSRKSAVPFIGLGLDIEVFVEGALRLWL